MINPDVTRYPAEAIERAVREFETPFFLYEEDMIRRNCRMFTDAFGPLFPGFQPMFAVKGCPNPNIIRIILSEGWGLECSSHSELWLARQLGSPPVYHTSNFTHPDELRCALGMGNVLIDLDDISILETVRGIHVPEFLSFRINPGITSSTMKSTLLAGPDAKFGIPWEKAVEAYHRAKDAGVKRFGIHMMTGSNVAEESYFSGVTAKLLDIAADVSAEVGINFETINIGGGFNVPYRPEQPTFLLATIAKQVREVFDQQCRRHRMKEPQLMVEPARRVTADAGFLVGTVQVIKNGYKKFVGLDVSTNAMPRTAIYTAYHHISVLGKTPDSPMETVNVTGSICENNDQWCIDRPLPAMNVGDTVVIHNCGAHGYAMGHNYNGKIRPAEYLLESSGTFRQIRRAETFEDLYRTVVPPLA